MRKSKRKKYHSTPFTPLPKDVKEVKWLKILTPSKLLTKFYISCY